MCPGYAGNGPATGGQGMPMRGARLWWLVLTPVLLGGCSALPGWSTGDGRAEADAAEKGPSWILVEQGRPSTSATPRPGAARSTSPTPGFLPLPSPTPSGTGPAPSCSPAARRPGQLNGLTVVPGPGTATVSWPDNGGRELVAYRVTATAQDLVNGRQPEVGWRTVTPTRSCATLSTTVTGLRRGGAYTITLEAVLARLGMDGLRNVTVARSGVISTT